MRFSSSRCHRSSTRNFSAHFFFTAFSRRNSIKRHDIYCSNGIPLLRSVSAAAVRDRVRSDDPMELGYAQVCRGSAAQAICPMPPGVVSNPKEKGVDGGSFLALSQVREWLAVPVLGQMNPVVGSVLGCSSSPSSSACCSGYRSEYVHESARYSINCCWCAGQYVLILPIDLSSHCSSYHEPSGLSGVTSGVPGLPAHGGVSVLCP